jgi:hypothetical protein
MTDLTFPHQRALSTRRLTLNLTVHPDGAINIRSCEVISRVFRSRTTFPDLSDIGDLLVPGVTKHIGSALSDISEGPQVISLPEMLIEIPGLVLSGAHILMSAAQDGTRNAIFRFKEFLGAVNQMFKIEIGFNGNLMEDNERLATNVLADICLPILNTCQQIDRATFSRPLVFPGNAIRAKLAELEFQTELLKRFILNSGASQRMPHSEIRSNGAHNEGRFGTPLTP